ncbi:DUF59 domain-containing protein [Thermococcus sp. M39]|uniref:iron-sulfur cluster assembly protein n=1 Tax=unclassified Thermococcus TaxID=2627626 RepID=UPI0014391790|nr:MULTISPECIES: iron-sulfur cluster assembly protein [unclassified Thermococcus]NJE07431.1 DUF59 domain-containing protein [Thermococcus sp. M39]NJE12437.1 DUF59 domain-containing protein [Thermococcus sp. LS2]
MGLFDFLKQKKPKDVKRKELPEEVRRVVEILKKVKDPETELSIVDEGLVYGLTVEGRKVQVFLLMARSTPECHFCRMIAINVQRKILDGIICVLKEEGFDRVEVYNELGLLLAEG